MKKIIAAVIAACALALPGAALANHVTDVDGPAVSSVNGICHSVHGNDWYWMQRDAYEVYKDAYLSTGYLPYWNMAVEHAVLAQWYEAVCPLPA